MPTEDKLDLYETLTLPVEAKLGRRMVPMKGILGWHPGSVISLLKPVGSKIEVYAGGTLLGFGEIVSCGPARGVKFSAFLRGDTPAHTPQVSILEGAGHGT